MDTNRDNDSNESIAPPRLIAALRRTQSGHVFVPRTADEAVLRAARDHLAPARQREPTAFTYWYRWLAFATAFVLLFALAYRFTREGSLTNPLPVHAQEDVNRDGLVDILDAFQLARQLQAGAQPEPRLDVNGDGILDLRDVEVIAVRAVKLEKGGRS